MNKQDIHKAAEAWFKKNAKKYMARNMKGMVYVPECCADFHLHQTKKMLEDLHEELLSHAVSCDAMAQSEAKSGNDYAEVIWVNKKGAFMVAADEVKKLLSKHDKNG